MSVRRRYSEFKWLRDEVFVDISSFSYFKLSPRLQGLSRSTCRTCLAKPLQNNCLSSKTTTVTRFFNQKYFLWGWYWPGIFEEEFIEERRVGLEVFYEKKLSLFILNLCPRGVNQQIFNYSQIMQILGTKVDLNPPQKLISPLLVQEFINKVAGHPLVQGERCLHMFLTEVSND